jgi:predicted MPP superfamily phosphohydrolase
MKPRPVRPLLTRRRFLVRALIGPALAGLYAWRVEPTWLEWVRRDLPIAHLPEVLHGKILVQLSDLHIGPQVDDGYLGDVFRRVHALKPEIVVHTGDLVTYAGPQVIAQAGRVLADFPRGRLGTFAVLGNHDYGRRWAETAVADQVARQLTAAGCRVLRNEAVDVSGLRIVGLDDLWAGRFIPGRLFATAAANQPGLALCHNPDACDLPGWNEYRGWILAGHTHGGQCRPPFLPPPFMSVNNRRYTAGEFSLAGGRRLYINRGVGHLLRVRFNVRPEVTIFRLTRA